MQAQLWFERCDPISGGNGCNVSGFSDQCSAIRLTTGHNYTVSGNYFHDNCGGMNGRGYDIDLEEWFYDAIIENNLTHNTAAGVPSNSHISVSMFFESVHAGPFQNITVRNNRFNQTDSCFSINVAMSGPQAINYYNNTCVDFRVYGYWPGGDNGDAGGTINFVNNIFAALSTSSQTAMYVDPQKNSGVQPPITNDFYCQSCSPLVNWSGQSYSSGNLDSLGTGNVYGNPGLDGSLKLTASSGPAYQTGTALTANFPDFEGDSRPSSGMWDIGADEYSGAVTSTMCTYAYTPWSACGSDGTQTRSVMSATPSGCTGTPVLTQSCVSAPPPPASTTLAAPSNLRVSSSYLLSNPIQRVTLSRIFSRLRSTPALR